MYVYAYVCMYVCLYLCVYVCMFVYMCVCVLMYVCVFLCVCMFVCIYVNVFLCMCVCVLMYVCMCIHDDTIDNSCRHRVACVGGCTLPTTFCCDNFLQSQLAVKSCSCAGSLLFRKIINCKFLVFLHIVFLFFSFFSSACEFRLIDRMVLVANKIQILLLLYYYNQPSMKRRKLWKTGEDGLCCSSSAIQTRLDPSSLLEERSETPIVFVCLFCVVGYPPNWGNRPRYIDIELTKQ